MKIAVVGKGGSGKSSISWLLTHTLASRGTHVLAIDADHNMDLTSNLGIDPSTTPLMHRTDKEFMEAVGLSEDKQWSRIVTEPDRALPTFTVNPPDTYTQSILTSAGAGINLINVGLGSPDVLFSDKCAHGLSGPLKYYLGMLDEGEDWVVIDSVAGTDMINYGLYSGIDAVIGVVEPHRNSVKVFEQIQDICRRTMIPCYLIINKPTQNEFYEKIQHTFHDKILGEIGLDLGVMNYNFSIVSPEVKEASVAIIDKVKHFKKRGNISAMKSFHDIKKTKA